LEVAGLAKTFGSVTAVSDLTFAVEPGRVTGFLGPNGAGKTTTLRCLLGLVAPSAGTALIDGRPYAALADPLGTVGAALEATGFHPGRTARSHLQIQCLAGGLPPSRAEACLDLVGLADAAGRRVGGFSLGMRQRLALATALLGDPAALILDEPGNGLDPAGMAWLRGFLRYQADAGRTVLVSSHLLAEVEQTVDDVVIIDRGRLVHAGALGDLTAQRSVTVVTPDAARLAEALTAGGATVTIIGTDRLQVSGVTAAEVGRAALVAGAELHELRTEAAELEQVFLDLTGGAP
jgi:ABC-2 type transport system ATP-binding protein